MRASGTRGSGLVEALTATALAAIGLAALALAATVAVAQVRLARERDVALALAVWQLQALRAGPRIAGSDAVVAGGRTMTRRWDVTPGRGAADALDVEVGWNGRRVELRTEALP